MNIQDNPDTLEAFNQLAPRHKQFITAYLQGDSQGNAAKSARACGYAQASSNVQGGKLLRRDDIQAVLEACLKPPTPGDGVNVTELARILWGIVQAGGQNAVSAAALLAKIKGLDKPDNSTVSQPLPFPDYGQAMNTGVNDVTDGKQ